MENLAAFLQQEIFTFGVAVKHKNEVNFMDSWEKPWVA